MVKSRRIVTHDSHCHFFSPRLFEALAQEKGLTGRKKVRDLTRLLEWDDPVSPQSLADRWVEELDRNGVGRAALIASIPGDEESVAAAVQRHPRRFVGFFMLDPTRRGAVTRARRGLQELGLRCICLYPAMHGYQVDEPRVRSVLKVAASHPGSAVFVHCGVLSLGVRTRLGLPGYFDTRLSNPLHLQQAAAEFPQVPFIVPHLGAGFLREALMVTELCPNVYLDTSSSNRWIQYYPGQNLEQVFQRALEVAGPERLLFGTDSSFFPRGWQRPVWKAQSEMFKRLPLRAADREKIFLKNFERLFPL